MEQPPPLVLEGLCDAAAAAGRGAAVATGPLFNYFVEDTSERCYRDVVEYLSRLGWRRVPTYRKRSKVTEKRRLPTKKDLPLLLWTLNEKDVDFGDLEHFQLCNHFEGISNLTTKRGFCELLRDMHWICQEHQDVSPRCFNLGDPLHREEFVEEFKIAAVAMVLKHTLKNISGCAVGPIAEISSAMQKQCMLVASRYLRIKRDGEWPGVERTLESIENQDGSQVNVYLTETSPLVDWPAILSTSYALAEQQQCPDRINQSWQSLYARISTRETQTAFRIWLLLQGLQSTNKQFAIDGNESRGNKNLWVVKAPEACRGLGLKVLNRLEDILECERGMGGRTVQKYVENPLLAPLFAHAPPTGANGFPLTGSSPSRSPSRNKRAFSAATESTKLPMPPPVLTKFDIRVWVLVTSFEPMQAHIFSRVYGRRCGLPYDDSVKSLGENLIHLTNYSIQRKNQSIAGGGLGEFGTDNHPSQRDCQVPGETASSVKKLRNVCDTARQLPEPGAGPASSRLGDLLVSHEEILQVVNSHQRHSGGGVCGDGGAWGQHVWPEIKRKIFATLEAAKSQVVHRERSFEFLGYDIILDDELTPWILEVNMSPAMAHRSHAQSKLISDMVQGLVNLAILPVTGAPEKEDGAFCADYFDAANKEKEAFGEASPCFIEDYGILSSPDGAGFGGEWELVQETFVATPEQEQQDQQHASTRPPRPISSAQALRNKVINEWSDGLLAAVSFNNNSLQLFPKPAQSQRPKSANGSMRAVGVASGSGNGNIQQGGNAAQGSGKSGNVIDVNFAIVGRVVNPRCIEVHDSLCSGFGKIVLLQSWSRRVLTRLRKYNDKRKRAATLMQAVIRCYLSKCTRYHLRRARSATTMQCFARQSAAWRHRIFLRTKRASTRIQSRIRGLLARRLAVKLRRTKAAIRIQRWATRVQSVWHRRAAFKIVMAVRSWLEWRRKNARRIFHLVALHYRRRQRARLHINRFVSSIVMRYKVSRRIRRQWAEMAARKGREWTLLALERRKIFDQAVSVKLEIIIYNQIYDMATELAVEAYAEALKDAAEEEAVAAAAAQETALAIQLAEQAAQVRIQSPNGVAARSYSELLAHSNLGAAAALPFGSLVMRPDAAAAAAAAECSTASPLAERGDDDDDDDDLLGTKLDSRALLPHTGPSPGKASGISALQSIVASFDDKSLALERDMQMRLLNLLNDGSAAPPKAPPRLSTASATHSKLPPRAQSVSSQIDYSASTSTSGKTKENIGSKARPKSAARSTKNVKLPFSRDASEASSPTRRVKNHPAAAASTTAPRAKSASKKRKPAAAPVTAAWDSLGILSLNPWDTFGDGPLGAPPPLAPFESVPGVWGAAGASTTEKQRQRQEDPEIHEYAESTNRLETERSLLLTQMLNTLLTKHGGSSSADLVFQAAANKTHHANQHQSQQAYQFASTKKRW